MKIVLTPLEVAQLKVLHKSQKDRRRADRIKIILLLNNGYSQKEVADILLLDEDTITTWKSCFLNRQSTDDLSSWLKDNYVGYVGNISYHGISQLRAYLADFNVATKARIKDYLSLSHQTEYSLSGIQKLLQRTGISHKKIGRIPGRIDVNKQELFIDKINPLIE